MKALVIVLIVVALLLLLGLAMALKIVKQYERGFCCCARRVAFVPSGRALSP